MGHPLEKEQVDETHPWKPNLGLLLKTLIKYSASDLHLKAERPPIYRISGKLIPAKLAVLNAETVKTLIYGMMTKKQVAQFEENLSIDFSYGMRGVARFRVNAYFQRGSVCAAIRLVPLSVPKLDSLGLPQIIKDLCSQEQGLILVTGNTGAGKSTTLAGMINYMNETRRVHILTIEDPIEFIHHDIKSVITQRELGTDAHTLADALKSALRQDPDVIVMGEMRDPETIMTALTAAETGHLVLSTMHTNDAKGTIDRILDVTPEKFRDQVRLQLAGSIRAVISQRLLSSLKGKGRIPAVEVMVKSPSIERLILENKLEEITEVIANSTTYYKMQTMNQALEELVKQGRVSEEEAIRYSPAPEDLQLVLGGFSRGESGEPDVEKPASINQKRPFEINLKKLIK